MNESERFIELWNDYLEGDLADSDLPELRRMLAGNAQFCRLAADSYQTHRLLNLIADRSDGMGESFVRATMVRLPPSDDQFVGTVMQQLATRNNPGPSGSWRSWAIAASLLVALTIGLFWVNRDVEPRIIEITQGNGSLQWTGVGGEVEGEVVVGRSLSGGTLESLAADSWGTLRFRDGTTVTVFGQSMLTISEQQQKQLHLRAGSMSAKVAAQPDGRPMLIHTPTARVEVLGTQVNVDAEPYATLLRVNEGRVRVTRLVDGRVAEVEADHQVVASLDRRDNFAVRRRPHPVAIWLSDLSKHVTHGEMTPGELGAHDFLRAKPLLLTCNPKKPVTLYAAAMSVSRGASPRVLITGGSRFRVSGRIESPVPVTFGLTTHHPSGGFAGKYTVTRPGDALQGAAFNIELAIADFRPLEAKFPPSAVGLELVDWWCFTVDHDAGLSVAGVELIPGPPPDGESY